MYNPQTTESAQKCLFILSGPYMMKFHVTRTICHIKPFKMTKRPIFLLAYNTIYTSRTTGNGLK